MRLVIPLYLILIWHLKDVMSNFAILLNCKKKFSQKEVPSCILSQNLWYNQIIQTNKESVHLAKFFDKNINTVSQLYDTNNFFINWNIPKERYKLQEQTCFPWV